MSVPLQEPTFFILTALAAAPLHGYGLISMVSELSERRVKLRPGTLYPALDRLTGEGLITVAREEVVDSRLRRYYELTDAGAGRLADEAARLASNAQTAAEKLAARARRTVVRPGVRPA
jgi:DNA-binding PadR family transcriptional regulator